MLSAFNTTELLETAMILFDMPNLRSVLGQLFERHGQVVGGPILNAAV
jgi:hypothetical protein